MGTAAEKVWKELEISDEETRKRKCTNRFKEKIAGAMAVRKEQEFRREAAITEGLEVHQILNEGMS